MNTLATSSRKQKTSPVFRAVTLFVAGMAGVVTGGTLWGFLGVMAVLFAVWTVNHMLDTAQRTRDIERFYRTSPNFLPTPQPVPQRVTVTERPRVFVRPAISELDSVRG